MGVDFDIDKPVSESVRKSGPNYGLLVPLLYAPLLPLMRIALVRSKVAPHIRDRALIGTTVFALGHAGYVMSQDSSMGAGA
uniref:Uncharacterized protein n=1 Tax=Tetraselmis sp. GSL018 TaxID=582737 RepID=A0A061SNF4_9CHLO